MNVFSSLVLICYRDVLVGRTTIHVEIILCAIFYVSFSMLINQFGVFISEMLLSVH